MDQPVSKGLDSGDLSERVFHLIAEQTGIPVERVQLKSSLLNDLGVDGDDAVELLESLAVTFGIDFSNFRFRDYFGAEGFDILSWFVDLVLGRRPKELLVADLVKAARVGRLELD